MRKWSSVTTAASSRWRSATTVAAAATATRAGTGWSGCASASPSTAGSSRRDRGPRAASPCVPGCRSRRRRAPARPVTLQAMAEPLSGTFTFLLTDIEGSTVLVRRLRDRYGETLAQHHRVLREAFEEAGGQGIGQQGDAVFVAFRRASEAILGAVAGQRA